MITPMKRAFPTLLRSTSKSRKLIRPSYTPLLAFPSHSFNSSRMVSAPTNEQFFELIKGRRTTYTLSQDTTIPDAELMKILETVIEEAPSSFGSFTTRLVVLVGEEHLKLWDLITEVVKGVTPPDQFENSTKARLQGFQNAYGTILFFEDPENTKKLQESFPFIKDHLPVWSQHTSAMHQILIWNALTNAGLGVNLQHYNPLIDKKIIDTYNLNPEWFLTAQMVFGKPTSPPGPKPTQMKKPLEERLVIKGANL